MEIPEIKLEKADAERFWRESENFFEAVTSVLLQVVEAGEKARLLWNT